MLARVITAAVGIPILVWAVISTSQFPIRMVLAAIGVICFYEFNRVENVWRKPYAWLVPIAFIAVIIIAQADATTPVFAFVTAIGTIVFAATTISLLSMEIATDKQLISKEKAEVFYGQVAWIFCPLILVVFLHDFESKSFVADRLLLRSGLLLLFLCLWAGDTAALLVGRAWGRHKMAPLISPGKTWEGGAANLISAVLTGWGLGVALGFPPLEGVLTGAATGVFGQLGDLAESAWKRRHGVKDSGTILPGHGGVLDRFDSLLFATPFVALIVYFVK